MKPISLRIKGLNSFIEEQFIDFNELTSEGLFGIFGPTGSGKSTVLDGITLALYGKVARNSSNIINTNCDKMAVSYRFQISGAEVKRYEVNREFKRDKKTGNPLSGKCRVVDITDEDNPIVLAEKVGDVTAKCREIIGLSLDDFTRTVVLPQGKFSEFLKLEGKSRRDMLERLFNLQEYGEVLGGKLRNEMLKLGNKLSELQGQMNGYEDVSDEVLKAKQEELNSAEEALKAANAEMEQLLKKYKESEQLWNLILELKAQQETVMILQEKKPEIEKKAEAKERGEAAGKVMPLIKSYRELMESLKETEASLKDITEKLDEVTERKVKTESSWAEWNRRKDEELPNLKVMLQKYFDAIEEKKAIASIKAEIDGLEKDIKLKRESFEKADGALKYTEERLLKGKAVTEETEKEVEKLTVSTEFKENVQRGMILSADCRRLKENIDKNENKILAFNKDIKSKAEEEQLLNKKRDEDVLRLSELTEQQKIMESSCPGTQNEVIAMQQMMMEKCDAWEKYNLNLRDIKANDEEIQSSNVSLEINKAEAAKISDEIEKIKVQLKDIQVENLAHHLRDTLKDGDVCPVCGSKEHHIENIKAVDNTVESRLNDRLKENEDKLMACERTSVSLESRINYLKKQNEKLNKIIEALGKEFKEKTPEELKSEFELFKNRLNEYTEKKEKLEGEINRLSEDIKVKEGKVDSCKMLIDSMAAQKEGSEKEKAEDKKKLDQYESELKDISEKTGVVDFESKNSELQAMEREKLKQEAKLKKCRELYQKLLEDRDEQQNLRIKIDNEITGLNSLLNEKKSNATIRESALESKFGSGINYSEERAKTSITIKEIEDNYKKLTEEKEKVEEQFNSLNNKKIEVKAKHDQLTLRTGYELKNVENALEKEKFESMDEVSEKFLDELEIKALGDEIKAYETEAAKAAGAVENITKRIGGRELTKEQWNIIKEEKSHKEAEIQEISERKIKLSEEVKIVERKLKEFGGLLKEKEKLDHKAALLSDLDKLFKGKKFVEFVAAHRLKYIAGKASKELKEISSGTYGLEVDENGSFIIRDYKNGGAARDASTLSGGETFLASLALALALSNEIQLKGTAPLELFFLDEGFGTLDDGLLDTVMDSLEKIHSERLKIGIISHVDSIKSRMPVKLIVTPAEAGVSGSKVRIEKN